MPNLGFISSLAEEFRSIVAPLENTLGSSEQFSSFLKRFGWDVPTDQIPIDEIRNSFPYDDMKQTLLSLDQVFLNDSSEFFDYVQLVESFVNIVNRIRNLSDTPPSIGSAPFSTHAFWREFSGNLLQGLVFEHLRSTRPVLFFLLRLLGILDNEFIEWNDVPGRVSYNRQVVRLDRVKEIVRPNHLLKDVYAWDQPQGNLRTPLDRLQRFCEDTEIPVQFRPPDDRLLDKYYSPDNPSRLDIKEIVMPIAHADTVEDGKIDLHFSILPIPDTDRSGEPAGVLLSASVVGAPPEIGFGNFHAGLEGFEAQATVGIEILPNRISFESGFALGDSTDRAATLSYSPTKPIVLLGEEKSTRLQVSDLHARLGLSGPVNDPELSLSLDTNEAELVLDFSEADSFLQKALSESPQTVEFGDLGILWSAKSGLTFKGSSSLRREIRIHRAWNTLHLDSLFVGLGAKGSGLELDLGVSGSLKLGPVTATVDQVGLRLRLRPELIEAGFDPEKLPLSIGFKPPAGIGVAIDAGPLTGGGYLSIDETIGRYSGILQLDIEQISIKAIGILDTRLPGGVRGFSFLILLFSEFPPMQLGWGFNLSGIGGLAGIHRTVDLAAMQAGVRSNGLDSILFPQNPVANAPRILSDLQKFFPPALNRFVFGPMALVGWGTPPVINAELGVLLELPAPVRLAILGKINLGFPSLELDPKLRAIDMHLDILGTVDFSKKLLAIDATLHDSRIGIDPEAFSIAGDMALRLSWGKPPIFALAVGGFHPGFRPPEGFPSLRRMTIAFPKSPNLQMTMQAYAALTANTAQFGAAVDFLAKAGPLSIQGTLGFDSLFTFRPFSLTADLAGAVAFRKGDSYLGTVNLEGHLTGPTPWHVWGKASLSTMFGKLSVPFDALFGKAQQEVVLPPSDPWPLLQAALADPRNWSSALPASASRIVTIVAPSGGPLAMILDPAGSLTVSEKVLPLDQRITKFGETTPTGPDHYSIQGMKLAGAPVEGYTSIQDYFAPGQFVEMNDSDKLSNESFTLMYSGVKLTDPVEHGTSIGTGVVFETMILDFPEGSRSEPDYVPSQDQQISSLDQGIVSRSPLRTAGLLKFGPKPTAVPPVTLREETFVIATKIDAMVRTDISAPVSVSQATHVLSDYVAAHPSERGNLQLVPLHEVEGLT